MSNEPEDFNPEDLIGPIDTPDLQGVIAIDTPGPEGMPSSSPRGAIAPIDDQPTRRRGLTGILIGLLVGILIGLLLFMTFAPPTMIQPIAGAGGPIVVRVFNGIRGSFGLPLIPDGLIPSFAGPACGATCDPEVASSCGPGLACMQEPDGGYVCWSEVCSGGVPPRPNTCGSFCDKSDPNACGPGLGCVTEPDGYDVCWGEVCSGQAGQSSVPKASGTCSALCDPKDANACGPGLGCVLEPDGYYVCWGDTCYDDGGQSTDGNICGRFCDPKANNACGPDAECVMEPDGYYVCWSDACYGDDKTAGTCGSFCDPADPNACGGDLNCSQEPDGNFVCWNDVCSGGTGAASGPTCGSICNPNDPNACGPGLGCVQEPDGAFVCWADYCSGGSQSGGDRPTPTAEPPAGDDICANNGGLQYQGEVCVCAGYVDKVTVCNDGTKFDNVTDQQCSPDPAACQDDGGGDPGGGGGPACGPKPCGNGKCEAACGENPNSCPADCP